MNKRFEQYENGLSTQDVRNKSINLKLRAQPNQTRGNFFYSGDNANSNDNQLNELQQLRLDMTRELRLMREDLRQAVVSSVGQTHASQPLSA